MDTEYQSHILSAWLGEVRGEVFFGRLAELSDEPDVSGKWATLAELERYVGQVLEPIVEKPEGEVDTSEARSQAEGLATLPIDKAAAVMDKVIDDAVDHYNHLKQVGPPEHKKELDILARHEEALQFFVKREMHGDADSLQAARELLVELKGA